MRSEVDVLRSEDVKIANESNKKTKPKSDNLRRFILIGCIAWQEEEREGEAGKEGVEEKLRWMVNGSFHIKRTIR